MKESTLTHLKKQGYRITKTRRLLLEIFQSEPKPQTEIQLRQKLAQVGVSVNKTTVYRELAQLQGQHIIRQVNFSDGKKRFELDQGHHHHFICQNCLKIFDVNLKDCKLLEKQINKQKKIHIINHSLEFFGLCAQCNN